MPRTTSGVAKTALRRCAARPGTSGAISPEHVCATIARQVPPEDIVENEAARDTAAVTTHMPRTLPGTYFAYAGGGLGFNDDTGDELPW